MGLTEQVVDLGSVAFVPLEIGQVPKAGVPDEPGHSMEATGPLGFQIPFSIFPGHLLWLWELILERDVGAFSAVL